MGDRYERQVELPIPPQEAIHRLYGALGSLPRASGLRVDGPWVSAHIGMSFLSWGEHVAAHVQAVPGRCLVTVRSKSDFALIDWGKNKKNVETVLARVAPPPAWPS